MHSVFKTVHALILATPLVAWAQAPATTSAAASESTPQLHYQSSFSDYRPYEYQPGRLRVRGVDRLQFVAARMTRAETSGGEPGRGFAALPGACMMLGLALTLPPRVDASELDTLEPGSRDRASLLGLWLLSVAENFVLSGFELGIVLQGGQHADSTTQEVSLMFAECSLVMLGVNAVLFFTSLLNKVPSRLVIAVASQRPELAWCFP